jgi:hypothetical protein
MNKRHPTPLDADAAWEQIEAALWQEISQQEHSGRSGLAPSLSGQNQELSIIQDTLVAAPAAPPIGPATDHALSELAVETPDISRIERAFTWQRFRFSRPVLIAICALLIICIVGAFFVLLPAFRGAPSTHPMVLARGNAPASKTTSSPTLSPTPTLANVMGGGAPTTIFSFEDGGTDGWSATDADIQNSSAQSYDGHRSLQVQPHAGARNPFVFLSGSTILTLSSGQTITAYVYMSRQSTEVGAMLFVQDLHNSWYQSSVVKLAPGTWTSLTYIVPSTPVPLVKMGIQFYCWSSNVSPSLYLDSVSWG